MCIIIFNLVLTFLFVIMSLICFSCILVDGIFNVYLGNNMIDETYVSYNLDIVSITDMSDITDTTDISDYIDYIKFVEDIDIDVK